MGAVIRADKIQRLSLPSPKVFKRKFFDISSSRIVLQYIQILIYVSRALIDLASSDT